MNDFQGKDSEDTPQQYPESPVPSDKHLAEGELPFTAFGQFGEGSLDLRVFEQDVYWVDVQGQAHLLTEMEEDYLFNVLAFLFNQAEYYYVGMLNKVTVELFFMDKEPEASNHVLGSIRSLVGVSATEWLNSTVLVKKINELLDKP